MRVFILCTGRSGSVSFIEACRHITNYTCDHESLSRELGDKRFNYTDNHIEADNRLSWFLGTLDKHFGEDPFYVHLIRDKQETADSFNKRWDLKGGIITAFFEGILMRQKQANKEEALEASLMYCETVNDNIKLFLKDKPNQIEVHLENIKVDFATFWNKIGAKGDIENAMKVFDVPRNVSKKGKSKLFGFLKK